MGDASAPETPSPLNKAQGSGAEQVEVGILMCTYNGATFLREQLDSFDSQSFTSWKLYVSDDNSTDSTRSILAEYQRRWGANRLTIFYGPCAGFAKNFISLIKRPEIDARYFAFSDQDDIWYSDKLQRSVDCLARLNENVPALVCTRTRLVNAERNVIGFSPLLHRPPSFRNALVQSIAGANTMLINRCARNIMAQLPDDATVIAHDWLAYLLVTASGGQAIYQSDASLDYRQHGGNLIGANASVRDRAVRLRKMLSGRLIKWNDANVEILKAMWPLLTAENQKIVDIFENARKQKLLGRLRAIRKSGIYRQNPLSNISLFLAVCVGRI